MVKYWSAEFFSMKSIHSVCNQWHHPLQNSSRFKLKLRFYEVSLFILPHCRPPATRFLSLWEADAVGNRQERSPRICPSCSSWFDTLPWDSSRCPRSFHIGTRRAMSAHAVVFSCGGKYRNWDYLFALFPIGWYLNLSSISLPWASGTVFFEAQA